MTSQTSRKEVMQGDPTCNTPKPHSVSPVVTKPPQPLLRKIVFQKRRQETFHSLFEHETNNTEEEEDTLQRADSDCEDFLRLPAVESLRITPSEEAKQGGRNKGTNSTSKQPSNDGGTSRSGSIRPRQRPIAYSLPSAASGIGGSSADKRPQITVTPTNSLAPNKNEELAGEEEQEAHPLQTKKQCLCHHPSDPGLLMTLKEAAGMKKCSLDSNTTTGATGTLQTAGSSSFGPCPGSSSSSISGAHSTPCVRAEEIKQEGGKIKRRVLHTVEQPGGGIIGYCTEEEEDGKEGSGKKMGKKEEAKRKLK